MPRILHLQRSRALPRRWLPKSLPVEQALDRLAAWQRATYKICKIHYAFIAGENDSEADVHAICDALQSRRLMVHVNIVRYNSLDPRRHGIEPPEEVLQRNAEIYRSRLPYARVRVIPCVGYEYMLPAGCSSLGKGQPGSDVSPQRKQGESLATRADRAWFVSG
jgi:23S rRNA (adenine2503-C2)-methyltransferase